MHDSTRTIVQNLARWLRTPAAAALLALGLSSSIASAQPAGGGPQPIFTRQTAFGIPFRMDPAEPGARRAVEVQLHVSENGGPWKLYAKEAPEEKRFVFRATRDGEYRFMVRTKDDHGELLPVGPPAPELIVILDTDPPVLELLAQRGSGGEVHARWRVRDTHLRWDSVRLEYQVGPDGPLQPVAIDLPPLGATNCAREATWVPETRLAPIIVRAEVADLAGNVAKTQQQVPGIKPQTETAGDAWRSQRPASEGAVADWPAERTDDTPLRAEPPAMAGSFAAERNAAESTAKVKNWSLPQYEQVAPRESMVRGEVLPPPPAEAVLAQPSVERVLPVPVQPEEVGLPPDLQAPRQHPTQTRQDIDPGDGPRLPWLTAGPGSEAPPIPRAPGPTVRETSLPVGDTLPSGIRPRLVRSRSFELDYEIDAAQSAAVNNVEAWGTADGGRTWASYGIDSDRHSPLVVTVGSDGLFGFRIAIDSNNVRSAPPRAGESADVWVSVDTTKPAARILAAELSASAGATDLTVRWEATDAALAPRPIRLLVSPQQIGPWTPIVSELENSGQFIWRLPAGSAERLFVRLEVRDLAGNVAAVETTEPVALAAPRPAGRIRDVRPLEGTSSASPPR